MNRDSLDGLPGFLLQGELYGGSDARLFRGTDQDGTPVLVLSMSDTQDNAAQMVRLRTAVDLGRKAGPSCVPHPRDIARSSRGPCLIVNDPGGWPLSRVIPAQGMRMDALLPAMLALARALVPLHAASIIHREIRPERLLLSEDGQSASVLCLDRATPQRGLTGTTARSLGIPLTHTSPELSGRIDVAVDERTDLFSLGAVFYQMACGAPPFDLADPATLAYAIVALPAPDLREQRRDLPPVLGKIIDRLLRKDPDDRYNMALDLVKDLQTCVDQFRHSGTIRDFDLTKDGVPPVFRVSDRLQGRASEQDILLAAVHDSLLAGRRSVVFVTGPSGIGKSAFVAQTQWRLAQAGATLHSGKFDQFRSDQPYLAFGEVARSLMRPLLAADDAGRAAHRAALQEAMGAYGALITNRVPELAALLGPQPEVDELPPAEAARRFNELIGRFTRYFARPESPIVLFLDDVQWADHASLNLLEAITEMPGLSHLMLVIGYRSNEVQPGHPAHSVVSAIKAGSSHCVDIALGPLDASDMQALVEDTLGGSGPETRALATQIQQITGGNAFFAREYLAALYNRGAISLDPAQKRWVCDAGAAATEEVPSSVASFVAERLGQMPEGTLVMLDTASCIGSTFDLDTLSRVHEVPMAAVAADLSPAIIAAIIEPIGSAHYAVEALEGASDAATDIALYRFRHDQIRLTVHDRLDDLHRAERHLQISRLLRKSLSDAELQARAVEVFRHVVWAADLIDQPDERLALAQLGLSAGRQAQAGLAFPTAQAHLRLANQFLPADAWQTQYQLKLAIMMSLAGCSFALNDVAELERLAADILANARDPLSVALIQGMRVRYLSTLGKFNEATDIAISTARNLGIGLPRKPKMYHVLLEMARALGAQGRKSPLDFVDLPDATNPGIRAAVDLLGQSASLAYFTEPNLLPLIGIASTRATLRHGVSPLSPYGVAVWALVLCGVLGMIDRGSQFGELALVLGKRVGGSEETRAQFIVNTFILHWKDPLPEVADKLYESWIRNRDAGDLENAFYCAGVLQYTDFLSGGSVDVDLRRPGYLDYLLATDMPHVKRSFLAWTQLFMILRGQDLPDDLSGKLFSYPEEIGPLVAVDHGVQISQSSIVAGILDHFAGRYRRAEERFALAQQHEDKILAQVLVPGLAFFRALNAFRIAAEGPADARALRRCARRQMRRVRTWARYGPQTMAPRLALLECETEMARGKVGDALLALHRATSSAGADAPLYGYMAQLRRAEILKASGSRSEATEAAQQALRLAEKLGSPALANHVRDAFDLTASAMPGVGAGPTLNPDGLDLDRFMDFVTILGTDADTGRQLDEVASWALRTANADYVVVALDQGDDDIRVKTMADPRRGPQPVDQAIADCPPIVRTALTLCLKSGETIATSDLARLGNFSGPDERLPRAVLCVPIRQRDRVSGAVYLHSGVSRHAFSAGRVQAVQAIAGQAGIALENARLLGEVQTTLDAQTLQSLASRRFVPEDLMRSLGVSNITEVGLNQAAERRMTVVFADLRGFTTITRELGPNRTIEMINRYLDHVQPGIAANGGFVVDYFGDGLLALFPNAPDDALFGVMAMTRGLAGYNRVRRDFPELSFRIGVHTGEVILGMIGEQDHIQCAVVGDAVNAASRLETLNKQFDSQVLITDSCVRALQRPERFSLRPLGSVELRGRNEQTEIFEFLDSHPDERYQLLLGTLPAFTGAMAAHLRGQHAEALAGFSGCARIDGGDPVAEYFAQQCRTGLQLSTGRAAGVPVLS